MAFMAPEALLDPPRYSEKLDIFSFGNIILSTVSHEWPEPCPFTQYEGDQLIALDEFQRRERHIELFTAQEKQLFLPIVRCCLENRPAKRPSSVTLVQELRHIESILPRGSHVAVPIEQLRQQLSVKEEECRQKDEALREKDEALRDKDAAIQAYRSTLHSQPVKIEPLRSQQAVAEQVHERSYFESSLSSSGHFAATDQQLRQQLSVMEEECRQKDEVIRDKESVIEGKNEALWRLDEIIRKNELVMSEKEEELKQKDITIRAQQIQIQRLTNQPAMSEMLLHEADLEELCYIPFGIKAFSVTPEGGTFPLGTEDASLQFPPGAVTKETYVRYGIILHGPFEFPAGYRLASVVVYLNLGTVTLVKPIYLSLADWCEKKAHMDSEEVMFIRAPHVLKEGKERKYQFSLHAMRNTDAVSVDVLQIAESKCLYTKVLDEGRGVQEWFCATPLHQIDDKCLRVRILFTWLSDTWIKVLEEIYMKQKKWQKHPEVPPLCTQFRINTPVEAIMSDKSGPGWTAILDGVDTVCILCVYPIRLGQCQNICHNLQCIWRVLSPFESRMSSGYISGATGLSSQLEYFGDGSLPSTSSHGSRSLTMPSPHATSPITSGDLLCQKPTMKDLSAIVIPRVASEWRNFGLQLDVESHMLNAIVTPNGRSVDHCFVMLGYWLNRRQGTGIKPRTWSSVLEAVADSCGSEVRRDITEELNL